MNTPSCLLLAASIAVGPGLPPAADGADEKLWVGNVTYTSRLIEKWGCDVQNEHCAAHCKVDIEVRLEFELFVVVAEGHVDNAPRASNFSFEEHWITEAEWRRFKKLCEVRPQHYVQPGDTASEKVKTTNHCIGDPGFRVRLSVNQEERRAFLSGQASLQITGARDHYRSYFDPCTAGENVVGLVPLPPGPTPTEGPVRGRLVPFSAHGIVSDDLRQITLSPDQDHPTTRERKKGDRQPPHLPEAPLTRTCPECHECDPTNDQWEMELGKVTGTFWRCDVWTEAVRSELLSELGDCFTSMGLLPTCVPALVTCVQAGRVPFELCDWMQCPMDAAGERQEELSECIDGAVRGWRRNDARCR